MSSPKAKSTLKAKRKPKAARVAKGTRRRLRPGELDGLVLAYMAEHKDEGPLSASAIGKGIERSSGAVANCPTGQGETGPAGTQEAPPLRDRGGEAPMTGCRRRSRNGGVRFPRTTPPQVNHAVLTGTLCAEPQEARGPTGERVVLLRVEFPVADPAHSGTLWTWASCLVEVPGGRAEREAERLHGGAPVLAAGQLSARWMIEGGHTSRRGVILATLLQSGPRPEQPDAPFPCGGGP